MNGRCERDALDRAEDICELCGHQFCASCLLFPRGHRNPPTCKTCALENSGLRGGTKSRHPISRRDYKKRKKELLRQLEGVEEEEPAIEYFDLADPSIFDRSTELDRRSSPVEEPESIDILGRIDESAAPPEHEPTNEPAIASPAPHQMEPAPLPAAEVMESGAAVEGLAPVDTSINPLALEAKPRPAPPTAEMPPPPPPPPPTEFVPPPPEPAPVAAASEASASAADLLARLKADQPIQSQFTSVTGGLDTDPFASAPAPASTPAVGADTDTAGVAHADPVPVAPPTPALHPEPHPTPSTATATPTSHPERIAASPFEAAPRTVAPAPSPAPARPKAEPWTPPAPPPRGSNLDAMGGTAAVVDVPDVLRPPPRAEPVVAEPVVAEPAPSPPPADTDDTGQWIPPSLRGMASAEDRSADPLPKRR